MRIPLRGLLASCLTVAATLGGVASPALADGAPGGVFAGTNHNNTTDPGEPANQVVMYHRAADGRLSLAGRYDTGGQGSGPGQRFAGDGLGAGNSVKLSDNRRWLFVTNAGSNDVSVFRVKRAGLVLTDVAPTGDGSMSHRFPNSVTQHGDLVYVLNSADEGSITGFKLTRTGKLRPLSSSTRDLAANQKRFAPDALYNPAQVSFTPDGRKLVVSTKDGPAAGLLPGITPTGPGRILVFDVRADGRPSSSFRRTDLANRGPFGFSFDRHGNLLVALFVGGGIEPVAGVDQIVGAAGSYRINRDGSLTANTVASNDHQLDTCWLVNNGRYAYGANYSSGTVSSWRIAADGSLELLESVAGTTENPGNVQGTTPLDMRTSPDGRFLYVVLPGSGKVAAWSIGADGRLTKLGEYAGLPQTVNGDHAPSDFSALGSPAGIEAL
jgi:6-phosphogluconolactonase (cycloisomerase 2 family)